MAENSDLETRFCLVWNTERPYLNKRRYSSFFTLLNSEWRLHMKMVHHPTSYSNKVYVIALEQIKEKGELKKPFRVTTFIEDTVEYNFPSLGFTTVVKTGSDIIWQYKQEKISSKIPFANKEDGKWRIVCLFHGVQGFTTQRKDEIIRLSDRIDLPASIEFQSDLESLSRDFSNLYGDEAFSDVKFKCGGITIFGHRAILAARSGVFASMFQSKMVGCETDIVDVVDLEAPILDLLLKYLYSGKLHSLSEDVALGLYEASDKYAVHSLETTCSNWMIRSLNLDNCVKFLTVAHAHGDVAFKEAVISFICDHEVVLESEAWLRFAMNPSELAIQVYQKVFKAKHNNWPTENPTKP